MENAARQFNAQSQNQADQFNASLGAQIDQFNVSQMNAMSQFNAQQVNQQTLADKENRTRITTANITDAQVLPKFGLIAQNVLLMLRCNYRLVSSPDQDFRREQFNAANAQAIAQADTARCQLTLAENAAENAANQQNAQNAFAMSMQEQQNAWQARDSANYLRQSEENALNRETQLYAVALGNETAAGKDSNSSVDSLMQTIGRIINGGP